MEGYNQDKVEMMISATQHKTRVVLQREHFQQLLDVLNDKGFQVVGPTVREQAIVYDTVTEVNDLPIGYTEEQDGGTYRLKRRADEALFGYAVGPVLATSGIRSQIERTKRVFTAFCILSRGRV